MLSFFTLDREKRVNVSINDVKLKVFIKDMRNLFADELMFKKVATNLSQLDSLRVLKMNDNKLNNKPSNSELPYEFKDDANNIVLFVNH